jgi:hypothetical protein
MVILFRRNFNLTLAFAYFLQSAHEQVRWEEVSGARGRVSGARGRVSGVRGQISSACQADFIP